MLDAHEDVASDPCITCLSSDGPGFFSGAESSRRPRSRRAHRALVDLAAALLVIVAAGCSESSGSSTLQPPAPASSASSESPSPRFAGAPRDGDRFRNLYPFELPTLGDLARWYWNWTLAGGTKPLQGGYDAIPVLMPDLVYLRANRTDTTVTWVGHSTVLLELAGLNVITDPMFSQRASPFGFLGPERKVRVPFTIAQAPHADIVLISHNHYDHLDAASVVALARQPGGAPLFIVPLGLDRWMRAHGVDRVVALDWWNTHEVAAPLSVSGDRLRITFVPAQHWSSRWPGDRFETLWGGYVIERIEASSPDEVPWRFYFACDTGYVPLFHDLIHARFDRFDLAAIPIGAYEPNEYLRAQHVNPEEVVRIHRELHIAQSIGIHGGTFVLTSEPFDQPPRDLAAALVRAHVPADRFVTFRHGEMRVLSRDLRGRGERSERARFRLDELNTMVYTATCAYHD